MNDTSGELVAIINSLITKVIFKNSKSVKFLIPITHVSMKVGRGQNVRESFKVLQSICYGIELEEMLKAVKPVITKCSLRDQEIDIDVLRDDLE